MYSLKKRLQKNLLTTAAIVMALLLIVFYQGLNKLTKNYVVSRLKHDAESLISAVNYQPNVGWSLSHQRMSTVYNRVRSGHYYIVSVDNQVFRSRSLFDREVDLPEMTKGKNNITFLNGAEKERLLVWEQKVKKNNLEMTIWVAEDVAALYQTQKEFLAFSTVLILFAVIFLVFIQYQILQRGFSSLEKIREAIKQIQFGDKNISTKVLPQEIQPLVNEINRLLVQLSKRVKRSRNALGNVAHELNRQLQHLRSQLELIEPEQRKKGEEILGDIHNIVERELKRAKIVGESIPGRYMVLSEELPYLRKIMCSIYPDKTINMQYPQQMILPQDRDDMLELFGNLLDNACKYAKNKISLYIFIHEQGWKMHIEDDGEGVLLSDLHLISGRGVRMDEGIDGHGLGLSICQDIVESYSGELSFESSVDGGLKVSIYIPDRRS